MQLSTSARWPRLLSLTVQCDQQPSLLALPCPFWPPCWPDRIGPPCRRASLCQDLPCDGAAPVDLECSSVSERNCSMRLLQPRPEWTCSEQAPQPTAQSTLPSQVLVTASARLGRVNEFTFDAFFGAARKAQECLARRGEKAFHTTAYAILGRRWTQCEVLVWCSLARANRMGRACLRR